MKPDKKRTSLADLSAINVIGGKTTKELFESNGITWTEEYEEDENMSAYGELGAEENFENEQ